jgi:hypothetical protein
MKHGAINTASDVAGSNIRVGSVAVTVLLTSVNVTFSAAMPDANYEVFLEMSGVAVAFTISAKATTGFTVSFGAGLNGTLSYMAVSDV